MQCENCNAASVNNEEFRELNLNILPFCGEPLQPYVDSFFRREQIRGYKCEK